MSTITYTGNNGSSFTLPLGRQWGVERESGCVDIVLMRSIAHDCPVQVMILLRTNGSIDLWNVEFQGRASNTYWHYYDGETLKPTPAQLHTLERMFLDMESLPGGLGGALGGPVSRVVFSDQTPDDVAKKHGVPKPYLNG